MNWERSTVESRHDVHTVATTRPHEYENQS